MRVLFMGTSGFAVPSLRALLESPYEVIGVVTQPDRPSGRGRQVRYSPVKEAAIAAGLPIYQPAKVRSEEFVATVRELSPDLCVVAAFGQIIPKAILEIPPLGNINVHGSLLPKYRGAAPVHYALFNCESVTGVTTMLMDPGLDTGPMLLRRETPILPEDDEATLEARLSEIGAELLIETIAALQSGSLTPIPQDGSQASHAPSVKKEECEILWNSAAGAVVGLIRGCTPRPGAYTFLNGQQLRLWGARRGEVGSEARPGEILDVTNEGIVVGTADGTVTLTEIQPESKRRMPAVEFARGYRVHAGDTLGRCAECGR